MLLFQEYEYTKPITKLGEGAYSQVFKIQHKTTYKIYALKIIDLKQINQDEKEMINNEIKIH